MRFGFVDAIIILNDHEGYSVDAGAFNDHEGYSVDAGAWPWPLVYNTGNIKLKCVTLA